MKKRRVTEPNEGRGFKAKQTLPKKGKILSTPKE